MTCHFCFMNFESILLEASNRDKTCAVTVIVVVLMLYVDCVWFQSWQH
jgi:hypothetical protein